MRNLLKYAHNETYVMPENAHLQENTDHHSIAWQSRIRISKFLSFETRKNLRQRL
jgi:hypothetical protein